ncbi:MAG: TspO/MBR family protein [Candidatus Hodarchaeota archaeon]
MNSKFVQVSNVIAILASIIFNSLVNIIPLNGVTTGEVSAQFPNLFTPDNYVFSIWGVIYTLLIIFMFYQARAAERNQEYLQQIGILYLLSAVFNIAWLTIFHFSSTMTELFPLTMVPIVGLFLVLLLTYVRLGVGVKEVPRNQKLAVHLPLSVYLGWLSVATIANTASTLNFLIPGIPTGTQEIWTALVLIVALVITLLTVYKRRDFAFGLVLVWASIGIATKQIAVPVILTTAIAAALIVILAIILLPILKKKSFLDYYMVRD